MVDEVTYESLQQDSDFLNNAYFFLQDMGERVSENPKDILDTFIEKRRAFDTNIFSTYSQGSNISEAPDSVKQNYRAALDKLDQMPDFYESGGAPTGEALFDYAYYGVTDPTNLLSILAGAFTLPAGGSGAYGILGAKQTASAAWRESMKAKLKASVSKPVLKAMALEGTIAGSGGATQGVLSQQTDMDIGRREEDDYDYANIVLQGLLEGTLSPLAGISLNLAGSAIGKGAKEFVPKGVALVPGGKWVNNSSKWGTEWLKRNFLPPSSQDKAAQRLSELTGERFKFLQTQQEKNSKLMDAAQKNFAESEGEVVARDIGNDILEGNDIDINTRIAEKEGEIINIANAVGRGEPLDKELETATKQLDQLRIFENRESKGLYKKFRDLNEGIDEHINDYHANIKELQQTGSETPYISNFLDETYFKTDRYLRDIYEKFHTARIPFEKFINKKENKNIVEDYMSMLLQKDLTGRYVNERKLIEMGVVKRKDIKSSDVIEPSGEYFTKEFRNADGTLDEAAFKQAALKDKVHGLEELYKPILNKQAKYGATYKIKDVPEVIKQLYGRNFSPAVRMMETTQGLINTITDLRMYGSLVDNLKARSTKDNPLIIEADTPQGANIAATKAGANPDTEWVPLKTEYNLDKEAEAVLNDNGTRIDFYDFDLNDPDAVFVIPGRMLSEEMGGSVQLPARTDFVSEEIARQLDNDFYSGVLEPGKDYSAVRRYVYQKNPDGTLAKDAAGNKIIKTNNEGNPARYAVDPNTGKLLPIDVQKTQMYVPKEFAKRYKEMLNNEHLMTPLAGKLGSGQKALTGTLNWFAELQGYLKKGKTIYNPIAIVRNALGAAGYMINTGNYSGLMRLADMYYNGTKEQREVLMKQAQRLGLKGSQIEINQILNRIGKKQVGVKGGVKEVLRRLSTGQVLGLLDDTKFDRALVKLYGVTDDVGKMGTWFSETASQQRIWKQMGEADKELLRDNFINSTLARNTFRKTPYDEMVSALNAKRRGDVLNKKGEQRLEEFDDALIKEIAAQKTLDVVPVYSRIPKILEKVRGIPVIGNFAAFPAENLRNKYQLFKIAGDEIREGFATDNMAMVRTGANRLMAQSAYAAAPATMAYFYNQMEGTSEAADAIREGLMDYQKDHAIAVRKGDNGKFYYTPFLAAGARGEGDMDKVLNEIFPRAAWNYLSSFMEPSLATNVVQDFVSYVQAPTDEERGSILARVAKTMTPGVVKSIAEMSADLGAFSESETLSTLERTFRPLYYGEQRKRFEDSVELSDWLARHGFNTKGFGDFSNTRDFITGPALASFGIVSGEKEWNPRKTFSYISRNLQKNVLEDLRKTKQEMVAKIGDPTLRYNKEDMLKEYNELFEEQFVAQQGIAKLIGLYSNVIPQDQLQSIIRDPAVRGSLSKKQIGNINKGKFYPEDLSKDFIKKIRTAYRKASDMGRVPQEDFKEVISDIRRLHNLWRYTDLNIPDPEDLIKDTRE